MDFIVDDEEAVVVAVGKLDELDFGVLFVVLLQVGEELLAVAGVDGGRKTFGTLGEQGEHAVVNEIVDEDDSAFGAANQIGDVGPCVPYAARGEDLFGALFGRYFFDSIENKFDLTVSLLLMMLDIDNAFDYLYALVHDLGDRCESTHNSNVDTHCSFGTQNAAEHCHTVSGKSIREITSTASSV